MDYAEYYIQEKQLLEAISIDINLLQLYEKLYLLIELVRIRGDKQTEAYNEIEKLSLIE